MPEVEVTDDNIVSRKRRADEISREEEEDEKEPSFDTKQDSVAATAEMDAKDLPEEIEEKKNDDKMEEDESKVKMENGSEKEPQVSQKEFGSDKDRPEKEDADSGSGGDGATSTKPNPYEALRYTIVRNDAKPESMIKLVGLKSLFAKQLPKMPRAYIARLVFDRRHTSLAILSDNPELEDSDEEIIGGICYRAFPEMRFAGKEALKEFDRTLFNICCGVASTKLLFVFVFGINRNCLLRCQC